MTSTPIATTLSTTDPMGPGAWSESSHGNGFTGFGRKFEALLKTLFPNMDAKPMIRLDTGQRWYFI
jgi:hypothetical protein